MWRKNTKDRIIKSMGGECVCCGYNKCSASLDIHHLTPSEKEFGLGSIRGSPKNWETIVKELKKCVLVCNRCHQEIHHGLTEVPENCKKFDDTYENYKKIGKYNSCPVCGKEKPIQNKTCSHECSAKNKRKVDWDKIDIKKLVENDKMSYTAIADKLNVSDAAVRKRYLKILHSIPL